MFNWYKVKDQELGIQGIGTPIDICFQRIGLGILRVTQNESDIKETF